MHSICLGNNTVDTHNKAQTYSKTNNLEYFGLVSDLDEEFDFASLKNGCYQTSICDLSQSRLKELLGYFENIVLLDQEISDYEHPNEFLNTVRCVAEFDNVIYQNNKFAHITYWENLVKDNKSFCIFPFIEYLTTNGKTNVCCRSCMPVADKDCDFKNDPGYVNIRQKLLNGERIPHCAKCYALEDNNILSARIIETVEWANRLKLETTDCLSAIDKPVYYEVRPSNKCNLKCRMCGPLNSHLIEEEYREIGLGVTSSQIYDGFEIVDFENLHKLYVSGGEPLIMKDFYGFLKKCTQNNKTDFEFLVNTNATNLNNTFKKLAKEFSNLQIIVSIDGFDKINQYIRWDTPWHLLVPNIDYFIANMQTTFNVTLSIYNVESLYKLFDFIDKRYGEVHTHLQITNSDKNDKLSPYNHPDRECVLTNLQKLKECNVYSNIENKSLIDDLIRCYENEDYNKDTLKSFFVFNDKLDKHRGVKLEDYLPSIAKYR